MTKPASNRFLDWALKSVAALLMIVLVWSVMAPALEIKTEDHQISLARIKMKTLWELERIYFRSDSNYTTDIRVLFDFANTKKKALVPDSLFQPVLTSLLKLPEYREHFTGVSTAEFRTSLFESLMDNPMTGEKFFIEIGAADGRKTLAIKPSKLDADNERIGTIVNGIVTWNEKMERLK